nr:MAG TPA: hypothetical protein [Caudoviricetes sp.]
MGLVITVCVIVGILNMLGVIDTMPGMAKSFFHVEEGEKDNIAIAITWFLIIPFIFMLIIR